MIPNPTIEELCALAVDKQNEWRAKGGEGRREAYRHFDRCLHTVAEMNGRSYEDVLYEAVEDWVTATFCCLGRNQPASST